MEERKQDHVKNIDPGVLQNSKTSAGGRGEHSSRLSEYHICIVADQPDWAFANIAAQLTQHLGFPYRVTTVYAKDYEQLVGTLRSIFLTDKPLDLVHFLWRSTLNELFSPAALALLVSTLDPDQQDRALKRLSNTTITTSVYDHLFLDDDELSCSVRNCLPFADGYAVSSQILADIYRDVEELAPPVCVLSDGVDLDLFFPRGEVRKCEQACSVVRIGWTGNSLWGGDPQHKGLVSVIMPAVERLKREGFAVEGAYQDRRQGAIPHAEMPGFYHNLDIYVCASLSEGTPNPVLEAMACGVPVLTTKVGIAGEAFGPLQHDFIVEDRESEEFYQKLKKLVEDPELRRALGSENAMYIQVWGWCSMAKRWRDFFNEALAYSSHPMNRSRRLAALRTLLRAGTELGSKDGHIHQLEVDNHLLREALGHAQAVLNTRSHRVLSRLMYPISWWVHHRKKRIR